MPNIGPVELIVVLLIVLVVIGPKKLPTFGRSLGTGMREFKDSISGDKKSDQPSIGEHQGASAPTPPPTPPVAEPAPPVVQPAPPLTKEPADQPAPPHRDGE